MNPKYPNINVLLVGQDGNAFSILGRVAGALRRGGVSQKEIDVLYAEATNGDYNHLLQTVMNWVNIDSEVDEEEDYDGWDYDGEEYE